MASTEPYLPTRKEIEAAKAAIPKRRSSVRPHGAPHKQLRVRPRKVRG